MILSEKIKAISSIIQDAKFDVINGKEFIWQDDRPIPTDEQIEEKIKELEEKEIADNKLKAIELHIYDNYSQKEQAQDNGWVSNFTTKLVASGVTDLDKKIVDFVASFLSGSGLDEILADVDDTVKPMYEKLVKVAVKNEWAYLVIQEGKKAIAENREPVYPEFPKFD